MHHTLVQMSLVLKVDILAGLYGSISFDSNLIMVISILRNMEFQLAMAIQILLQTLQEQLFDWYQMMKSAGLKPSILISSTNKKHDKETRCPVCPMSFVSAWSTAAASPEHESPVISAGFGLHFRISL